jgi:hypothetical protein
MGDDLVFGQSAKKAVYKPAVFEHKHCWDALDLILGSQAGRFVHIDFYEFDKSGVLRGEFVDNRKQDPAMTAPSCPDKDQYGARKPDDFVVERMFVRIHRILGIGGSELKGRSTLAADSFFSCPRTRNAIFCPALAASDYKTVLDH